MNTKFRSIIYKCSKMPRSKYARKSTRRRFGRKSTFRSRGAGGFRKKRFSKYRLSGNSGIGRGPSSSGFPLRMFKTFTYSGAAQKLTQAVTDVPISTIFRGNSMYDPDYTGIGSQPRWYDTFLGANDGSAPYSQCTVLASKITVSIWQDPTLTGTSGSTAGVVSVIPYVGASTAPTSLKEIQERAFVRWKNVGNANSHKPLVIKHFAKTRALYQGVNPLTNATNFQHAYNGNPNSAWYWTISAVNIISGAGINTFNCYISARIKYYVMLSSLNDVSNS